MEVVFQVCTQDIKKLGRTGRTIAIKDCKLKLPCDVLNPTLQVRKFEGWNDCNLFYIGDLNRVYYLSQPVQMLEGGIVEYNLHVDVLATYADALKCQSALIDRNEFLFSPYIVDERLLTRVNRNRQIKSIGHIGNPSGAYYALTVTGGV